MISALHHAATRLALVASLAFIASCAPRTSPEEQVRAAIAAAEQAAEARDVGATLALVADDYGDDNGFDKARLRDFVRGYFVLHPSLELIVRIESVEFPAEDLAQVQLGIASVARRGNGASGAGLNLDSEDLRVEFVQVNGEWRVCRVDRGAVQ
jgi:hypothetical protein